MLDLIAAYAHLTLALLTDGHLLCLFVGAWFIFFPAYITALSVYLLTVTIRDRRAKKAPKRPATRVRYICGNGYDEVVTWARQGADGYWHTAEGWDVAPERVTVLS